MKVCSKHKKYKGKRPPTNNCEECLALYTLISLRPRAPIVHTKIEKKVYNRQKQKKIKE